MAEEIRRSRYQLASVPPSYDRPIALATYTFAPSARRAAGVIHRAFDSSIPPETRQKIF
ncbi:hypothetical protein M433DRAFT_9916 [Acidomyces richmondensis BFW]|nr:hypothetical protein M433DRAFT_9916 [Acidomyces richmondensis BFW]